jgi:hypothetical protein
LSGMFSGHAVDKNRELAGLAGLSARTQLRTHQRVILPGFPSIVSSYDENVALIRVHALPFSFRLIARIGVTYAEFASRRSCSVNKFG